MKAEMLIGAVMFGYITYRMGKFFVRFAVAIRKAKRYDEIDRRCRPVYDWSKIEKGK